jgi:hypothetical protein
MKKCLIVAFCLSAFVVSAQYRVVDGKVLPINDPSFIQLTNRYEVVRFMGQDVVMQPFKLLVHSKMVKTLKGMGAETTESRKYFSNHVVFRNFNEICKIGEAIPDQILWAVNVGRTNGCEIYDFGTTYVPPKTVIEKRPLTAEDAKAQDAKNFKLLEQYATAGNSVSAYYLGECYLSGKGCEVDTNKAIYWFIESFTSKEGNPKALNRYNEIRPHPEEDKPTSTVIPQSESGEVNGVILTNQTQLYSNDLHVPTNNPAATLKNGRLIEDVSSVKMNTFNGNIIILNKSGGGVYKPNEFKEDGFLNSWGISLAKAIELEKSYEQRMMIARQNKALKRQQEMDGLTGKNYDDAYPSSYPSSYQDKRENLRRVLNAANGVLWPEQPITEKDLNDAMKEAERLRLFDR